MQWLICVGYLTFCGSLVLHVFCVELPHYVYMCVVVCVYGVCVLL